MGPSLVLTRAAPSAYTFTRCTVGSLRSRSGKVHRTVGASVFVVLVNASLLAQGLNWSAPQSSTNTASPPGGLAGRPAISGVYFNFAIWAAERVNDSSQAIMMLNNNGSGTTFYNQGLVILPGGGYALSAVSPALTAMNGSLYLAYTDTNGLNQIISSQNGTDWTGPSAGPSGTNGLPTSTQANPAITADPANNTIYTSYTNGQYFTPIMCQWVIGNQPMECPA